jgi:uncharacterized protein (TIGR03435 family)
MRHYAWTKCGAGSLGRVLLILLSLGGAAAAQQTIPTFEVASVKPQREPIRAENASGIVPRTLPGGRFFGTHATLESLLAFAYDVRPYRIVGGPDWMRQDRFAIDARAEGDPPVAQIRLMLRSLLEERFALVTHMEKREMRVQALVRARPDGSLGPNIFQMDVECTATVVNDLRRKLPDKYRSPGNGVMSGCSTTGVNFLAEYLTLMLGLPVIDATELAGPFYYSLSADLPPPTPRLGARRSNEDLPALSTALAEQLALKMESRTGPVEVLVVDAVHQPTPD